MTTPPLVSAVIPNYNYGRYLRESVESALEQTHPRMEVIVVDDGSTDDSLTVLKTFGDRIIVLNGGHKGVSAARNLGITHSSGDFVAFLDADDRWRPDKTERQLLLFSDNVGLVHSGLRHIDDSGRPLGLRLDGMEGDILVEHALLQKTTISGGGSTALLRRSVFDRIGGFAEELSTSADWDMWRRVSCCYQIGMVPEALADYRLHGSSMHRNLGLFEHDMLLSFARMFSDPVASSVHALKRGCYSNLYLSFCGSYIHAGNWRKGLAYGLRSLALSPTKLPMHVAKLPLRSWRRRRERPSSCEQELVSSAPRP